MRRLPLAAALAVAVAACAPAAALAAPVPTLTIDGSGSAVRAPDEVTVTYALVTNDTDAARAGAANEAAYDALRARLKAAGAAPDDVRTAGWSLVFEPRPAQPDPAVARRYGYVVTRTVTVTSADVTRAGALVDAGAAAGADAIAGVDFGLRDRSAAERAALAAAVADAQARAAAAAAAAGVRIVRVLRIAPQGAETRPVPLLRAAVAGGPATEIPAGSVEVRAAVDVSYEIAPIARPAPKPLRAAAGR